MRKMEVATRRVASLETLKKMRKVALEGRKNLNKTF